MFELLDRFRDDVATRGLERIIHDHFQYEGRRYDGNAFTSRLATKDNPIYGSWMEPGSQSSTPEGTED
jgi:hypothetical protein